MPTHEREAHIVARPAAGAITIATNMAGRAPTSCSAVADQIDALVVPTKRSCRNPGRVAQAPRTGHAPGGLHMIGTERHESRRIDNQLRAAPAVKAIRIQPFLSVPEDNLMRSFGDPTQMKALMTSVGVKEGEAIGSGSRTRQIERGQRRVEQHHFDARKQLL